MPKRSVQEKLERYERKIKKLRGQCHGRNNDSSGDEYNADMEIIDTHPNLTEDLDNPQIEVRDAHPEEVTEPPLAATLSSPAAIAIQSDNTEVQTEVLLEPNLDPELLLALGASISDSPDFGEPIHDNLATLWLPVLRKGLPKDDKDKLIKENLVPTNCKLLQSPTLNPEISAAVSDVVRNRDKKLSGFQQVLGQGISAVNRGMNTLLKSDDKANALRYLSDSCRLLSHLHHSFTRDRVKLIEPSLEKNILQVIQDTERDNMLFGTGLSEKIKACKAIEKQGQQIRKTNHAARQSTMPQPSTSRLAQPGNWPGPPRYPPIRGGRGGHHRSSARGIRRPFVPIPTQAPKSSAQTKYRANVRH